MTVKSAVAGATLALTLAACSSAPFSYSQDRCRGQQNQCQNSCASLDFGPSRSACIERCIDNENRCYASGYNDGSPISEELAIGDAKSRAEKEADYKRWKAQKDRERAAAEENE